MEKDNRFDYEAPNIDVVKLSMQQALLQQLSTEDFDTGQGAWDDNNN